MGFSISSPDLEALVKRMDDVDVGKAVARAINDVADGGLIDRLRANAEASGASVEMSEEICTFKHRGRVYVGIPKTSPFHREGKRTEFGDAVGAPGGWLRATIAREQHDLNAAFATALTTRLLGGAHGYA